MTASLMTEKNEVDQAQRFTRWQRDRVRKIVDLWIVCELKLNLMDEIAQEGPSVIGKLIMFEGCIPQSSGFIPETLSAKAEDMRHYQPFHDELQAKEMIFELPLYDREYVTAWPQMHRRENPQTGELFTRDELYRYFGCCEKTYKTRATTAKRRLLQIDEMRNPKLYKKTKSDA